MSLKEVLESYNHIELTEDEMIEGMIWAKRKKADTIRLAQFQQFQKQNMELKKMQWDFDITKTFMINRAKVIFDGKFVLDEFNEKIFNLFCYYFCSNQDKFESLAEEMKVKNPSIKKGILLPGDFGVGKTWLMRIFAKNARQCFFIRNAKVIADEFLTSKDKKIPDEYLSPFDNSIMPIATSDVFNQKFSGLCIDDIGSEDLKNNYGNKSNVIGDLIEQRYAKGYTGLFLHGTTNLTSEKLKTHYGGRVASRLREIFNFIPLHGTDRRK